MGWTSDAIYRAVDRGIIKPRQIRSGAIWWEFELPPGLTWEKAKEEVS